MCSGIPGLEAHEPRIIMQRKCPPKMVLALDEKCYLRSALPADLRKNRQRKAPVSWRDAQYIKKGIRASKKIEKYTKDGMKEYRKLVPRPKTTTTKRKR